jgi:hypothetical protein
MNPPPLDPLTPGAPVNDPPKQTRFRPPPHDGAQDAAHDLAGLLERHQRIRTDTPATDADPQGDL